MPTQSNNGNESLKSPPYSPVLSSQKTSLDDQTIEPTDSTISSLSKSSTPSAEHKARPMEKTYLVASHSVRISKFGYAVDPIDIGLREIIKNQPVYIRRASQTSFDSQQPGHIILDLIRGFWSQPSFPDGQLLTKTKLESLDDVLNEFMKIPFYPHTKNRGRMSIFPKERYNDNVYVNSQMRSRMKLPEPKNKSGSKGIVRINVDNGWTDLSSTSSPIATQGPNSPSIVSDLSQDIKDKFRTFSPSTSSGSSSKSSSRASSGSSASSNSKGSSSSSSSSGIFSIFDRKSRVTTKATKSNQKGNIYQSWIPMDRLSIFNLISDLCKNLENLFDKEERIVKIESPCLVMGDIHGNLDDLRTYERSLWPKAPICCSKNFLFLGDYVDRGDFSIESVLYLFAMKSLAPKRFFMLRGNHEISIIQKQYTFSRECEVKFGIQTGRKLWRIFNRVFDLMPIAAIIDNKIFCAHGGIPKSISNLETLNNEIPKPLENPEFQCPSAWEILWNDPVTDQELIGMIEMDNSALTPPTPQQPSNSDTSSTVESTSQVKADNEPAPNNDVPSTISDLIKPDDPPSNKRNDKQEDNENAIKSVPSDTSSIASTSPQQMISEGFVANIKRGTAYLFSDQATDKFLKNNNLSHVIRAHEVIPNGYAFHADGRVITIFSSSKYCGLNNQAACALVYDDRIRILRLDTDQGTE